MSITLNGNPSQSHGASPAIWDHTELPATQYTPPAKQAGTRFTYLAETEG